MRAPEPSRPARDGEVSLDVIVPLYNEEAVVDALLARLGTAFAPARLAERRMGSVRFLFVDDGSADRTSEKIAAWIEQGGAGVLIQLSRNFGHQNAVSAGLDHADADLTAIIDADLQDPPEVVCDMVDAWRGGADVVDGVREKRKEGVHKVFCYWSFYRILSYLSEVKIPLDSGDFCLMDRKVVEALRSLPERLRFHRGLRAWVGFRHARVPYERQGRAAGASKYTFRKLYRLATDGVTSSSTRPLRIAQFFCLVFALMSLGSAAVLLRALLSEGASSGEVVWMRWISFLISISGFMVVSSIYVLSAYIGRAYLEVKGRPPYIVHRVIRRGEGG